MPKRECPFDYDLLPQMKMHVGQKEFDAKNEQNMSQVHDKTLQILFNGAKQNNKNKSNSVSTNCRNSENKCFSKNVSEYCAICVELNVAECKCSFCDKWVCQSCSAECVKCEEVLCVAHSLKLYRCEKSECVCLNCCVED